MAYAYSGIGEEDILMSNGEKRKKTFNFSNTHTPLCLLHRKQIISGKSCDVYDLCAPLQPNGTQYRFEYTEVWTSPSGHINKNETKNGAVNYPSSNNWGSTGISTDPTWNEYYKNYKFNCSLPIFASTSDVTNYMKTGDTSNAEKDAYVKWDLYIDGTKNPLYKLTWDCADIPSSDTSRVKVLFCAKDDTIANTYIVKDSHYYKYNNKSVKLNYHDIHDAVWGDMGGLVKGAVTIIVQFEYFETTTVVPKDTSAYMYCELYPNETNGHMYGDIGFCKVGEHSTWFVKTDSGDGSTFTAHEGTDGSEGYTKDDDKGYDDNKDKDDDDDDTHVLSSGIGVLTSTFHMTKERLVQLGQFL